MTTKQSWKEPDLDKKEKNDNNDISYGIVIDFVLCVYTN